jgi:ubiquinone/menaquinone biosynthesis C-methylase UbiE/nicotinamide mononucleotide adenylyltransferase
MNRALLLGRFHAVTLAQSVWLESLNHEAVDEIICVITSANHAHTKRNPLPVSERRLLMAKALARTQKPFYIVAIDDIETSEHWVAHVLQCVERSLGIQLSPLNCVAYSANRAVELLLLQAGLRVKSSALDGPSPHDLIQLMVDDRGGNAWQALASPETIERYANEATQTLLQKIYSERLVSDDGELGHQRDFLSYGAQMDASLRQKLIDLMPFVRPGRIVDKGCGTGKLLVELSRIFRDSRFVGVDLSREFLRMCDENTYTAQDVEFVQGNVIDQNVKADSASCIIYSSVMHEVHSYSGYLTSKIDTALANAFVELQAGGVVLVRDGVSPPPARWRLRFLKPELRPIFLRFATEFCHGRGVAFESVDEHTVELTSHDANEFICKKDYQKNWHIEVHEEFGPLTLTQWKAALLHAGFEMLHASEYVNEWILRNRYLGEIEITDLLGVPVPWPATNCLLAARKPIAAT